MMIESIAMRVTRRLAALLLSFALVCVMLCGAPGTVDAMVTLPLQTGSEPRPVTLAPGNKFAYVSLHYEGTPNDDAYILALRTWIQSIRLSGTSHDIVIICSDNVSQKSRNSFRVLGAEVRVMENIPNPYKQSMTMRRTYKPRFEFTFNKLYLWALTDYDRVLYMDADNIVLYNIDELFLCGHFCAVFMNMVYFHSGLLVVRPDQKRFDEMYARLQSLEVFSYDGADQGFFVEEFKNLEYAPLFHLDMVEGGKPLEHPEMRLPIEYNVNHLYFNLAFSWDTWRSMGHYFSDYEIPALSIAFPIAAGMKPWYWYGTAFFNPNWIWQSFRATLPDEEYWVQVWFPLNALYFVVMLLAAMWFSKFAYASTGIERVRKVVSVGMARVPLAGVKVLGYLMGLFVCFFMGPKFACHFIPSLAPAHLAWLVFIPFRLLFIFFCLHMFTACLIDTRGKNTALVIPRGLIYMNPPPFTPKSFLPLLVAECICLLLGATHTLYSPAVLGVTFVAKGAIVVVAFFSVVCIELQLFACAAEVAWLTNGKGKGPATHATHHGNLNDDQMYPDSE
jgi:hypothetical protein